MEESCIILRSKDYKVVPWKNGQGTTIELCIEPEGATVANGFHWRISSAFVSQSGPFSKFEGYSRVIFQLEGTMELSHPNGTKVVLSPVESYSFPGDIETNCTILEENGGKPLLDFNVMTKNGIASAKTEIKFGNEPLALELKGKVYLIYVFRGQFDLEYEKKSVHIEKDTLIRFNNHNDVGKVCKIKPIVDYHLLLIEIDETKA
jgi:environmental stress-induced protein Ves